MNHENNNEALQLCSQVFIKWNLIDLGVSDYDGSSEYSRMSFIAKVLRKKMAAFEIPVEIPDPLLMIIELCTDSNPGMAQIMLKKILGNNRPIDSTIMPEDFVAVFPTEFPILALFPRWEKEFEEEWLKQKTAQGFNLCDTKEWWMESFKL